MGKWFGQAAEIEELRAQNHRLKTQVESLEARLRVAYAQAGIAALAGDHAAQPSGVGTDGVLPGVVAPAPGLNDDERALASSGRKIKALKAYKDRTGVDLKQAKAMIDEACATEHVSLELSDDERALASSGRKLEAVKAYKDRTGVDLKQAKAAVDAAL